MYSTDKLHDEFEILKVKDIIKQEVATFVHNFFSNSLPPVFDGILKPLSVIIIETHDMAVILLESKIITQILQLLQ